MSFLLIPNEVYQDRATIWAAAINENLDLTQAVLVYGTNQLPLAQGWSDFATQDRNYGISYQRVTLNGLSPRTPYNLSFRVGGAERANASIMTLPDRLPVKGERPFTVLLGSCYFGHEDKAGAVGQTYLQLPSDAQPDIKILCGDQVYLDNPFL